MQSPPQTFPSIPRSLSFHHHHHNKRDNKRCSLRIRGANPRVFLFVLILWFIFVSLLCILSEHVIDGVRQWGQFPLVDQLELLHEIDKVLETRVQMRLSIKLYDLLNVVMVHMSVDSEQPLQNGLYDLTEVFRK